MMDATAMMKLKLRLLELSDTLETSRAHPGRSSGHADARGTFRAMPGGTSGDPGAGATTANDALTSRTLAYSLTTPGCVSGNGAKSSPGGKDMTHMTGVSSVILEQPASTTVDMEDALCCPPEGMAKVSYFSPSLVRKEQSKQDTVKTARALRASDAVLERVTRSRDHRSSRLPRPPSPYVRDRGLPKEGLKELEVLKDMLEAEQHARSHDRKELELIYREVVMMQQETDFSGLTLGDAADETKEDCGIPKDTKSAEVDASSLPHDEGALSLEDLKTKLKEQKTKLANMASARHELQQEVLGMQQHNRVAQMSPRAFVYAGGPGHAAPLPARKTVTPIPPFQSKGEVFTNEHHVERQASMPVTATMQSQPSYSEWRAALLPKEEPLLVRKKSETSAVRQSSYTNWRESLRQRIMAKEGDDSAGSGSEGTRDSHESAGNTSTATPPGSSFGASDSSDRGSLAGSMRFDCDQSNSPSCTSPEPPCPSARVLVPRVRAREREQERELLQEREREVLRERERVHRCTRAGVSPVRRAQQR